MTREQEKLYAKWYALATKPTTQPSKEELEELERLTALVFPDKQEEEA